MPVLTSTGALRAWWAVAMLIVTAALIAGVGIVYTHHVQAANNRKFCALLDSLDQPTPGPVTPHGQQIQTQIHQLRLSLGCGSR